MAEQILRTSAGILSAALLYAVGRLLCPRLTREVVQRLLGGGGCL